MKYALIQAQFKGYEKYILNLISEDKSFTMIFKHLYLMEIL